MFTSISRNTKKISLASVLPSLNSELLLQFVIRNIQLRYKGSQLGFIWMALSPLLMLSLYVFVFGYIYGGSFGVTENETEIEFALTIFLGLTIHGFVGEILGVSPTAIVAQSNLVKKVVFPLEILPAAAIFAALFQTCVGLTLVITGLAVLGNGVSLSIFWLPVVLLPLLILMLGVAYIASSLGVFIRDVGQLSGFISMVSLFSSAVFYPISEIPPAAWSILKFNPLLICIELTRSVAIWDQPVRFDYLAYLYSIATLFLAIGLFTFKKLKAAFADVL